MGDDWAVFAEKDGRAQVRPVQVGHRNGLVAEVLQGLEAGDRVLSHLNDRLAEGVRITARERG
jgi:HlyD family secretion protein